MKTGEELRRRLGLTNVKNVLLNRVVGIPVKTYFVWYDSFRPTFPITRSKIKTFPYSAMAYFGHNLEEPATLGPLMDIDEFNMSLNGIMFIAVDLAGHRFINYSDILTPKEESKQDLNIPYLEIVPMFKEYTLSDLHQHALDDHTLGWLNDRKANNGKSELVGLTWNDENRRAKGRVSTLTLEYKAYPTYTSKGQTVTKQGQWSRVKKFYSVKIQFQEINEWVENRYVFSNDLNAEEKKEFMDGIIKFADVKVYSNDPSWLFQGHFYNAADLDYSLYQYPPNIPKPTGHWARIKTGSSTTPYYSLSKHVIEVLGNVIEDQDKIIDLITRKYGS